ncbi:unnamed protein product [Rotaria magnacalcarata]|uniref:Uncharacterized protein n=1 Tax=Rotaria magnacalcarata TaxID=392030 RepID=A0A816U748_9BILA|nr:unnamed protein product [Rotaria magnacalcarata]CAF3865897.1 unnamed protein product [Rotaria magnacalcarata]
MAEKKKKPTTTTTTTSTVNKNLYENIDWSKVEEIKDIIDIIDDDYDTLEYSNEELDEYFKSGHLNSIVNEEEMIEDGNANDDLDNVESMEEEEDKEDKEEKEEVILSQKFSQLSTKDDNEKKSVVTNKRRRSSAISSPDVSSKKTKKIDDNHDDDIDDGINTESDTMPIYLLTTNRLFVQMAQNITKAISSISMNDIQQVALLMHQVAAARMNREMMKVYLHSVKGTLKEPECDLVDIDR